LYAAAINVAAIAENTKISACELPSAADSVEERIVELERRL
jgi:hypothetical protein